MSGNLQKRLPCLYVAAGLGTGSLLLAHDPLPSRYTYQEHVLPIIEEHCAACHRSGGIALMSLLDYQEAISWANSMKLMVLEGVMPPWLPKEGVGWFGGARSLSAEEIDILVDWAGGGTPEGEARAGGGPHGGSWSDSGEARWSFGEPDLVLEPDEDVVLGEDEAEKNVCLVLPTGLDEAKRVTALEFKPGASTVVHDVTMSLGDTCSSQQRPVATWLPDDQAYVLPEGVAEELRSGTSLALEIHYRKTWADDGREVRDRSKLGLYFTTDSDRQPVQSVRVEAAGHRFLEGARILAFFPVASSVELSQPIKIVARRPDGETSTLLQIERFDPAWRAKYKPLEPISLPPATVLEASSATAWVDYLPGPKKLN